MLDTTRIPVSTLLKAETPDTLDDVSDIAGLPASFVSDLVLRHLGRKGELKLFTLAQALGLPVPLVDGLLRQMRTLALVEVPRRGTLDGDISYVLTDAGHRQQLGVIVNASHRIRPTSKQRGVTSIEYALIAVLIAVAILGGLSNTGAANGNAWVDWTKKIVEAIV